MDTLSLLKISDINLASALLCRGHDVKGIDNQNPKRVQFFFIKTLDSIEDVENYWRGELHVDAKAMTNYRRELLTRLREESQ